MQNAKALDNVKLTLDLGDGSSMTIDEIEHLDLQMSQNG